MVENAVVFAVGTIAYATLGLWLVLEKHIVVFDGLSRLSHAYFVWWNDPPKLAAIGFVWPPIATAVFLPLAAIRPLDNEEGAAPSLAREGGGSCFTLSAQCDD